MAGFSSKAKGIRKQRSISSGSGELDVSVITPERLADIKKILEQYYDVLEKLKAAKLRGEQLDRMEMERRREEGPTLMNRPLDELNLEELLTLKSLYMELKEKLIKYYQERTGEAAASISMSSGGSNDYPLDGSRDDGSSDEL